MTTFSGRNVTNYLKDFDSRQKLAAAIEEGNLNHEENVLVADILFTLSHPNIGDDVIVESATSMYTTLDELFYSTRERPR